MPGSSFQARNGGTISTPPGTLPAPDLPHLTSSGPTTTRTGTSQPDEASRRLRSPRREFSDERTTLTPASSLRIRATGRSSRLSSPLGLETAPFCRPSSYRLSFCRPSSPRPEFSLLRTRSGEPSIRFISVIRISEPNIPEWSEIFASKQDDGWKDFPPHTRGFRDRKRGHVRRMSLACQASVVSTK